MISQNLPFQAVSFDMDDTLLRDDLTISDRTVRVLRGLSDVGVHIIPASGRARMSILPFVEQLSCSSLYITCNGAELWDGKTHSLLHREQFSAEIGREIAAFGKKHNAYAQTYEGDSFFFNEHSLWSERYAAASMLKGVCVGDLESFIREPRTKILMMAEEEKIAAMLAEARVCFAGRVSVTCSKPWFLEFNPTGATKGLALERAASLLGITLKDCIAFGDSLNDLSMLEAAGRGVLMENGRKELRSRVDDLCGTNQEDGVAAYLEKVFGEAL